MINKDYISSEDKRRWLDDEGFPFFEGLLVAAGFGCLLWTVIGILWLVYR